MSVNDRDFDRMVAGIKIARRTVRIAGVCTRSLSVDGDGPPILLLHGFTDSADTWRPLLKNLGALSRAAIAVDLPGHGFADKLRRGNGIDQFDRFTKAFIESYAGHGPVILAGNSLGGLLALRAAQVSDMPLIAVAPINPGGLEYGKRYERTMRGFDRLTPLLRFTYRIPVPRMVVQALAWRYHERNLSEGRADPQLARRYAGHIHGMADVRRLGAVARQIGVDTVADPVAPEHIDIPVLLIWGGRDEVCPVSGAERVLRAVPTARLVVFKDCGHVTQIQRPTEVATLLAKLPDMTSAASDLAPGRGR